MQRIAILGATGSIGGSTLDVVARHPGRFSVHALTANSSVEEMLSLCLIHRPKWVCMASNDAGMQLESKLRERRAVSRVLSGPQGLEAIAADPEVDTVVAAIVGAAGLPSSLAAARAGKRILLANKEALVMAGGIFMAAVKASGAQLLPIDSEHNAIFQCLSAGSGSLESRGVRRLILTASGGPFRDKARSELVSVTPEQACAHPNWSMGPKISVDSATMMNKALEVIEAHWLFGLEPEKIEVLIHPQSIVHSMVDYFDGSVLAQLGNPDMRTPIAHALSFPERIDSGVKQLDLAALGKLEFQKVDYSVFPTLALAYKALALGGTASTVLNAANEIAVAAFLVRKLPFLGIAKVIERTLGRMEIAPARTIEMVLEADRQARLLAESLIAS